MAIWDKKILDVHVIPAQEAKGAGQCNRGPKNYEYFGGLVKKKVYI